MIFKKTLSIRSNQIKMFICTTIVISVFPFHYQLIWVLGTNAILENSNEMKKHVKSECKNEHIIHFAHSVESQINLLYMSWRLCRPLIALDSCSYVSKLVIRHSLKLIKLFNFECILEYPPNEWILFNADFRNDSCDNKQLLRDERDKACEYSMNAHLSMNHSLIYLPIATNTANKSRC